MTLSKETLEWASKRGITEGVPASVPDGLSKETLEWASKSGILATEEVAPKPSFFAKIKKFGQEQAGKTRSAELERGEFLRSGGRIGALGIRQTPEEILAGQKPLLPIAKAVEYVGKTIKEEQKKPGIRFGVRGAPGPIARGAAGFIRKGAELAEGLTSPETLTQIAATVAAPQAALVFIPGLAKTAVSGAKEIYGGIREGEPEAIGAGLAEAVLGTAGAYGIGRGVIRPRAKAGAMASEPVSKFRTAKEFKAEGYEPYGDPAKGIWIKRGKEGELLDQGYEGVRVGGKTVPRFKARPGIVQRVKGAIGGMVERFRPEETAVIGETAKPSVTKAAYKERYGPILPPSKEMPVLKIPEEFKPPIVEKMDRTGFTPSQKTFIFDKLDEGRGARIPAVSPSNFKALKEGGGMSSGVEATLREIGLVDKKGGLTTEGVKARQYAIEGAKEGKIEIKVPDDGTLRINNTPDAINTVLDRLGKSEYNKHIGITKKPIAKIGKKEPLLRRIEREGKPEFVKAEGLKVEISPELDTYLVKDPETKVVYIIEKSTGLSVGDGPNKLEAVKNAEGNIEKRGIDAAKELIRKVPDKTTGAAAFTGKAGVETKAAPSAGGPVGTMDIIRHLQTAYEVPVRFRKFRQRAAGIYNIRPRVVRLARAGDITSAAHEIGHHIDRVYFGKADITQKGSLKKSWATKPLSEFRSELGALDYEPKKRRPSEGFAEYMRLRLSTEQAAEKAPTFHKWFNETFLKENPDLETKLNDTRALFDRWRTQGAEARVLGQIDIEGKGPQVSVADMIWKGAHKLQDAIENQLAVFKRATEEVLGKEASDKLYKEHPAQHPYALAMAFSKTAQAKTYHMVTENTFDAFMNVTGKGLKEILAPVAEEIKPFLAFAYSRHALNWFRLGLDPGIDIKDAQYVYEKGASKPGWEKAAGELTGWMDRILDYYREAGGITADGQKYLRTKHPAYIPLKRVFDEQVKTSGPARGYAVTSQIKKARGSGRQIENPIMSMMEIAVKMIDAADKIRVVNSIINLAEKTDGGGWMAEKVPPPMLPQRVTADSLKQAIASKRGVHVDDPLLMALEEALEGIEDITTFKAGHSYYGKDNIHSIIRNGEREFWQLDPDLSAAMSGMDYISLGTLGNILSMPSRAVRLGATGLRAGFALFTNPARDIGTYLFQANDSWPTPLKWLDGFKDVLTRSEEYRRWQRGGGEIAQPLGLDKKSYKQVYDKLLAKSLKDKTLNVVKHPIEALKDIFGIMEAPGRIAAAKAMRKKYPNADDAAIAGIIEAADVTINFKRMGKYGAVLNSLIAFFNPALQGISKFGRTWKENPGRSAVRASVLASAAISLWFANKDEEWWQELPLWRKMLFFNFNIGGEEDPFVISLPAPFEWGVVFGTLPVAYLDSKYQEDPDIVLDALKFSADQFLPDFIPTAIKSTIEVKTNFDMFRDRPIVSLGKQNLPPELQYSPHTTWTARVLGDIFKSSPIKIEHWVRGHTGGMGLDIIRFIEDTFNVLEYESGRKKEAADIPVIGRAFTRMNAPGESVNRFYDKIEKYENSWKAYRKLMKEGSEEKALPYLDDALKYMRARKLKEVITEQVRNDNYKEANRMAREGLKAMKGE